MEPREFEIRPDEDDPDAVVIRRPPLLKVSFDPVTGEEMYSLTEAGKKVAERQASAEGN